MALHMMKDLLSGGRLKRIKSGKAAAMEKLKALEKSRVRHEMMEQEYHDEREALEKKVLAYDIEQAIAKVKERIAKLESEHAKARDAEKAAKLLAQRNSAVGKLNQAIAYHESGKVSIESFLASLKEAYSSLMDTEHGLEAVQAKRERDEKARKIIEETTMKLEELGKHKTKKRAAEKEKAAISVPEKLLNRKQEYPRRKNRHDGRL